MASTNENVLEFLNNAIIKYQTEIDELNERIAFLNEKKEKAELAKTELEAS